MPAKDIKAKDTFYLKDAKYSLFDIFGNHEKKEEYIKEF